MEQVYEQDISINPDALDVEWVKQAQTFFKYAQLAAQARDRMDRQKDALDVIMAGLGLKIRTNPASYGLEKITEAGVQAAIILNKEYTAANDTLNQLKYEYEVLSAAVRSLDQKKTALENLVRLQGQSYFAGPESPRNIGKEWSQEIERSAARGAVKRSLNRKG